MPSTDPHLSATTPALSQTLHNVPLVFVAASLAASSLSQPSSTTSRGRKKQTTRKVISIPKQRKLIDETLDATESPSKCVKQFPTSQVRVLETIHSDHAPILIEVCTVNPSNFVTEKPFRFEASWISSPDCEKLVRTSWRLANGPNAQVSFQHGVEACQVNFKAKKRRGCNVVLLLKALTPPSLPPYSSEPLSIRALFFNLHK
ncbi:hypothetical protein Salat_1177600 [Sesamum alatum]|uniref:Uncharacterized protein n=1 Tax=Sesamum alatum TaxID=300844 RepID=A0AAE2CNL7_9LAMI|nr:hypothetical protein Salat_1177600 [Sesamum alatum]